MEITIFYRSFGFFVALWSLFCSTVPAELPQTCGVYRRSCIEARCDPADESSCMALEASEEQVRTSGS
jgi:hypothetical protein